MSVYVSDNEMELLRELYDFYNTQMEGASLDTPGQLEFESKSTAFWSFYEKCRKSRNKRNFRNRVMKIVRKHNHDYPHK